MNITKIFFIISSAGLAYSACYNGLESCGDACYNPSEYSCENDILCPIGNKSCGEACYDPSKYHCVGSTLKQGASTSDSTCNCVTTVTKYSVSTTTVTVTANNAQPTSSGSSSCWAKALGYECCSDPNAQMYFEDSDGKWSVENGDWCGINTGSSSSDTPTSSSSSSVPTSSESENIDGYKLVFSDEFDGSSLDRSKWTPEVNCWGGGNAEKQCYVDHPETIFVKDGALHLKAVYVGSYQLHGNDQCTLNNENSCSWTQPVISGRINTKSNGLAWKYGKIRVKALLPSGPFLWPAIWMLPQDDVYGTWAASGEIDIMEARGQAPDIISHAIHFGGQWPDNTYLDKVITKKNAGNEWHVYGIDWERDYIKFTVDEVETHKFDLNRSFYSGKGTNPYTANRQPFDQSFHLLLNVAVGGGFFDQSTYGTFNPEAHSKQWSRPDMTIDYVRVYQKK